MGADAARPRPGRRRAGVEPARLGPADRQDPPRPAPAGRQPAARDREFGPPVDDEHLFRVVDALDEVAAETGKTVPQIAINWLLQRPTVSSVIIGARNEEQLRQNLGAVGWTLTAEQIAEARRGKRRHRALSLFPLSPPGRFRPAEPARRLKPADLAPNGGLRRSVQHELAVDLPPFVRRDQLLVRVD